MKKYLVSLVEETVYRKVIHADSIEEAETIMQEDVDQGGTSCLNSVLSTTLDTIEYNNNNNSH